MVKRDFIIIFIFVLIICIGITEQLLINSFLGELNKKVLAIEWHIDNDENLNNSELSSSIEDVQEFYHSKDKYLSILINRTTMKDFMAQIDKIQVYCEGDDKLNAKVELEVLVYYIEECDIKNRFTIENIF